MTEIILPAGHAAVELAFFVLLPVMVVMLSLMRLLEAWGVLDRVTAGLAPLLRPFGITGLGVFAALQINFVGFAAPVATLTMMEQRGTSDRHLAATLAMVFAMSQANASLPLAALGLHLGPVLLFSLVGGLGAAAITYYGFGRHLSAEETLVLDHPDHPNPSTVAGNKGVLEVINHAGAEAFRITIGAIPLLVLALVAVMALRSWGVVDALVAGLGPLLGWLGLSPALILPVITKYVGGGTAMMGVVAEMLHQGQFTVPMLNQSAGLLINPLDLPGVAILISAGRRVTGVWKPAALGAGVGIALRTVGQVLVP